MVFAEDAAARQSNGLGTIADIELGEEASQLGLDRVFADVEMVAELPVGTIRRHVIKPGDQLLVA